MSNKSEKLKPTSTDLAIAKLKKSRTFLDKINEFVNWKPIKKTLKKFFKRNSIGNSPYPSLKMFKVLLLQSWYNLSDREMDDSLSDRISFRRFVGFSFEYDTPDYSTICRFRNSLIEHGLDEKLFNILNRQLESNGLIVINGYT